MVTTSSPKNKQTRLTFNKKTEGAKPIMVVTSSPKNKQTNMPAEKKTWVTYN